MGRNQPGAPRVILLFLNKLDTRPRPAEDEGVSVMTSPKLHTLRWLSLVLVAALVFAALPVQTARAQTTLLATVANASYLNTRSGPGPGYTIVGRLTRNMQIVLIGRNVDNSWVQMQGYGTQWVNARYLAIQGDINTLAVTSNQTPTSSAFTAVIQNAYVVNVRSGPGIGFQDVGRVYKDQQVTLVGRSVDNAWVQLAANTPQWINSQFAVFQNGSLGALPISGAAGDSGGGDGGGAALVTVVANAYVVNVRSGPGIGYTSVGRVSLGQEVRLIGRNADGSWVQLQASTPQWMNAGLTAASRAAIMALTQTANTTNPNPGGSPGGTPARIHVVQQGQTLYSIARAYGVNLYTIAAANGIYDVTRIYAGQQLIIP